jgi:hypothetical protein
MRHFSRRYFAKFLVVPFAASIVRIAKSDESEAKTSPTFKPYKSKPGTLHVAIFPQYVKPNQILLYSQDKRDLDLGMAVIFVQLVSDGNATAHIRYRIMDPNGNMGRWRHKDAKNCENKDSPIFKTKFSFDDNHDLTVETTDSGEVRISGYDHDASNNPVSWTSSENQYDDEDVTWN